MILDLYAGGPSRWSTALGLLGQKPLGLEFDRQACATRAAIGHWTLRCDIATYPVAPFFDKVTGLCASPPCQSLSQSGKGEGRKHIDRIVDQILNLDWRTDGIDGRTAHVLHAGRWVSTLMPEWVCFEQVRAVQPAWDAYAEVLETWGYSSWTGKLCAADFGTPQTRTRSILVASRVSEVSAPVPSHAKGGAGGLKPWVSMGEALDCAFDMLVGFPRADDLGTSPTGYRERDLFPTSGPAQTVTEKARSWQWFACDYWLSPPGYHDPKKSNDQHGPGTHNMEPWEALVLQDFHPATPLQGSKTAQFRQVGNAIPVRLAFSAVVAALGDRAREAAA